MTAGVDLRAETPARRQGLVESSTNHPGRHGRVCGAVRVGSLGPAFSPTRAGSVAWVLERTKRAPR